MDISQSALAIARAARYNGFEINRGLSLARRNRYFERQEDNHWVVRPDIRLRVQFEAINLTRDFSQLGRFDLIFCRNVTIYFTPRVRERILSTMTDMLEPGGALLLGATESPPGRPEHFRTVEFEGCVYVRAGGFG